MRTDISAVLPTEHCPEGKRGDRHDIIRHSVTFVKNNYYTLEYFFSIGLSCCQISLAMNIVHT